MKPSFDDANYCNQTLIVKVIVENVITITCFLGHSVYIVLCDSI